ncbi:hypothetical protein QZH41_008018, partial [Actinostola sp. cb2023]
CPVGCECDRLSGKDYTVSITSRKGVSLTTTPGKLPPDTVALSLRSNKISFLDGRTFVNNVNLTALYLNSNDIEVISDELFINQRNLKILYLNDNRIKKFTMNTFKGLDSIEKLFLQNNAEHLQFAPGIFQTLTTLKELRVDDFFLCCHANKAIPDVSWDLDVIPAGIGQSKVGSRLGLAGSASHFYLGDFILGTPHGPVACDRLFGSRKSAPAADLSCGIPPDIVHGVKRYNNTGYNSTVRYECKQGYALNVTHAAAVRRCTAKKQWDVPRGFVCHLTCGIPPDIVHGIKRYNNTGYNSTVRYECKQGYTLDVTHAAVRRCTAKKQWDVPQGFVCLTKVLPPSTPPPPPLGR